ncbi:hypothetical protein SELMODRAFT_404638 [Selaginella moellendorffii]|uniref:Cupin-like domain-containing protein n=1 Tax=Selaginella moellendorffii TaxID=88036 RepID=D8QVY4_SELML|nr:hypothetical protein SELMODRAFT_404638 [Selaginella moellendorffii]
MNRRRLLAWLAFASRHSAVQLLGNLLFTGKQNICNPGHLLAELKGGFLLQGSWRKTYISARSAWTKKEDFSSRWACTKKEDFSPVKVEDFYSDYLFQSWLCASVEIKDEWIFRDNIERRSHLSVDDFVRDFERPNKPVLITHAINDWPALERWNQEYLLELCGDELTSKVVPTIVKLFASTDRAIRASFSAFGDWFFGHLCPATRTNVEVNAHSCTKDHCNLHSESSRLKEDLLSKLQVDEELVIRTNTTILLGNIAGLLNDSTRKRVLINAFTVRAPRDGFAPAKGCWYYGPHSHKPILRCGRDCYSSLVALTIDADSLSALCTLKTDKRKNHHLPAARGRRENVFSLSQRRASRLGCELSQDQGSRPTEPNIRHSFNRVLGTYRRHCCRCSIRGASPRPLSDVRDGWDDMEDSAAATATPSLSRIQAAQQRPIASAPRPSHTNTNGPEQTTTGATVSRQASKTQVSDDEDPWAEIAAPPPSTKPRAVVSTQSRVRQGQHVSLGAMGLGGAGRGSSAHEACRGSGGGLLVIVDSGYKLHAQRTGDHVRQGWRCRTARVMFDGLRDTRDQPCNGNARHWDPIHSLALRETIPSTPRRTHSGYEKLHTGAFLSRAPKHRAYANWAYAPIHRIGSTVDREAPGGSGFDS